MEPLSGLDAAFLAIDTVTARFHVGAVVLLDDPGGPPSALAPAVRYAQIRQMVEQRLHLVPQFRQRAVRLPLDLVPPLWVDDPGFCLDHHLRRAGVPAPGGRRELDELVSQVMARPLPTDRPLWEMLVVDGLAGGGTALVAKLHHAILDGVSGATVMAALFDVSPPLQVQPAKGDGRAPGTAAGPGSEVASGGGADGGADGRSDTPALPSWADLVRHVVSSLLRQPEAVLDAVSLGADALVEVREHNRHLAAEGVPPPPAPFHAPRTPLNGTLSPDRGFATMSVPLDHVTGVRRAAGIAARNGSPPTGPTFNDVVLCATGMAADRFLARRGHATDRPLVALVPVSTRRPGPAEPGATAGTAAASSVAPSVLGNRVSGMLVALGTREMAPLERLRAVTTASRVAKEQEQLAWGRLLESVARATPHAVTSLAARSARALRLFDWAPPLFNLVVSTVLVPDVPLWVAGLPLTAAYPVGPIGHGVGLNVTTMTYRGTVHFGVLACRRRVPDVDEIAMLLADAVAELRDAATGGIGPAT